MVEDAKLVFTQAHEDNARLVFGLAGGGDTPAAPPVEVHLDAALPGLESALVLRVAIPLGVDADLPGLEGRAGLLWDAGVSRGHVGAVRLHWQDASARTARTASAWQDAPGRSHRAASAWQAPVARSARSVSAWQDAPLRSARLGSAWQDAMARQRSLAAHWQEARRLSRDAASAWQDALAHQHATSQRWQEAQRLRMRAAVLWQDALVLCHLLHLRSPRAGNGRPLRMPLASHWQDARRPPPGESRVVPHVPVRELCYDPATLGQLVFMGAWEGDARLVFVCQRPGAALPPAQVYVPARRSYVVINTIEIFRADTGELLPSEAFGMTIDHQSWTWSFSATFHRDARDALMPASGVPVVLLAQVNGQPFRLLAESIGRSVRFPERLIKVSGRGHSAWLDAPHAPVQSFSAAQPRTAHQLLLDALTVNGVGMGWVVDWQLTDWPVPASVWLHQGTWASAANDIAAAAGGYVQPHDTDPVLRVLPLWPRPWWQWDGMTPDLELPAGIAEVEDTEWIDRPAYDRVFVSGEGAGGVLGDYRRAGAAGALLRPMAVHPLITDELAARQRAVAELADSGRLIQQTLTLMVLPETGVIKPGTVLRYTDDDGAPRLGIVRSASVNWSFPVLTQTIGVQSHA